MRNTKILRMVQLAVLIALILIMAFTNIGYIKAGVIEISLIMIPVVIGSMVMGAGAGAILGLVFGLTSFYQCFGMSAFGAVLLGINPFLTFLVCVVPRVLAGWLPGLIFKAMMKVDKTKTVSYFVCGLLGAFFNTLFFTSLLLLCFWKTDYIQSLCTTLNATNVFAFVIAFVGLNGALEMPASCVAGGMVSKALSKAKINKLS